MIEVGSDEVFLNYRVRTCVGGVRLRLHHFIFVAFQFLAKRKFTAKYETDLLSNRTVDWN